MVKVEVKGLKELGERMRDLSSDVVKRVSKSATLAAAGVARKKTRERIQSMGLVDTGNMRAAVSAARVKNTKLTAEYAVGVKSGGGKRSGDIPGGKTSDVKAAKAGTGKKGVDAFYWRFLELGTVKRPATPFLVPAFEASKEQAIEAMKSTLDKRIKAAGK